jgi:hypothetical protein
MQPTTCKGANESRRGGDSDGEPARRALSEGYCSVLYSGTQHMRRYINIGRTMISLLQLLGGDFDFDALCDLRLKHNIF